MLSAKDQQVAELKGREDKLSQKLFEVESIAKHSYAFAFETVVDQIKHFFPDNDLNFDLLDPSKFMVDILGEQPRTLAKGGEAPLEKDQGGEVPPEEDQNIDQSQNEPNCLVS